jgi:hypothetical protein
MEEFRDLSVEEWNFRDIIQKYLEQLLEQQRIYWQLRGRIKWTTLGDENTKKNHANATIKHNKNTIMVIQDKEKFKHEEKETVIWEAFKERLGTSEFSCIHFNLDNLLKEQEGLDEMVNPFCKEEIDSIIIDLPLGKSPGPDRFNTDFLQKCWPVLSNDLYELCEAFYNHEICLQSINNSYIVPIPKVQNPSKVLDYRPISLLDQTDHKNPGK